MEILSRGGGATEEEMLSRRGRKVLAQIPGVREVILGEAIEETATQRHCWQLRLASVEVIEALKKDQDYLNFTRRYLREEATQMSTTSYRRQQLS